MGDDMVSSVCFGHDLLLDAHAAQWLLGKLYSAPAFSRVLPPGQLIPALPWSVVMLGHDALNKTKAARSIRSVKIKESRPQDRCDSRGDGACNDGGMPKSQRCRRYAVALWWRQGTSAMGNSKERLGSPGLLRVYKVLPCCVGKRRWQHGSKRRDT